MTPLFEAALDLQAFCTARQWRFCIIGGIAVLRWGEPRFTRDVDVTLFAGFGCEDEFTAPLLAGGYGGRIADAAAFARRNRVLLVNAPDCALRTCSAEDLIVHKLFAFRTRDLLDAESVAVRQRDRLDWPYIEVQLAPLADVKNQPEIMAEFHRLERAS